MKKVSVYRFPLNVSANIHVSQLRVLASEIRIAYTSYLNWRDYLFTFTCVNKGQLANIVKHLLLSDLLLLSLTLSPQRDPSNFNHRDCDGNNNGAVTLLTTSPSSAANRHPRYSTPLVPLLPLWLSSLCKELKVLHLSAMFPRIRCSTPPYDDEEDDEDDDFFYYHYCIWCLDGKYVPHCRSIKQFTTGGQAAITRGPWG